MTFILHIETATKVCSIALSKGNDLLGTLEVHEEDFSHSEKLNLLILELLSSKELSFKDLNAIAISGGPGSYTGLRIGVSTAKGICYACNLPLIEVNTLAAMAEQVAIEDGLKIPLIDARRMEVFTAVYDPSNKEVKEQYNCVVDEDSFNEFSNKSIYLFGNGSDKLKATFASKNNIHFIDNIKCSAKGMAAIGYQKFLIKDFVDVAYYEPNYGKEFYTTAKI